MKLSANCVAVQICPRVCVVKSFFSDIDASSATNRQVTCMIKNNQRVFNRLMVLMDAILTGASFILAYLIKFYIFEEAPEEGDDVTKVMRFTIDPVEQAEPAVEEIEEVKTRVETVLLPKVEEEIEPTVGELKTWVENKEYLQDIDLDGYATEEYVDNAIANIEHPANPTKVSELENDANYTNEAKVLELIADSTVAAGATIGIDFTTNITVGHLASGTKISKTQTLQEILYNIL